VADETVPEEEVEANPLDLAALLPDGAVCLGYAIAVKLIYEDGGMGLKTWSHEITPWEAIGMHKVAIDDLAAECQDITYVAEEED